MLSGVFRAAAALGHLISVKRGRTMPVLVLSWTKVSQSGAVRLEGGDLRTVHARGPELCEAMGHRRRRAAARGRNVAMLMRTDAGGMVF